MHDCLDLHNLLEKKKTFDLLLVGFRGHIIKKIMKFKVLDYLNKFCLFHLKNMI